MYVEQRDAGGYRAWLTDVEPFDAAQTDALLFTWDELLAWPRDLHAKDFGALVRQAGFTHAAWVSLDGLLSKDFDPLCVPRYGLTRRSALIEVALLLSLRLR